MISDLLKKSDEGVDVYVPLEGIIYRDKALQHLTLGGNNNNNNNDNSSIIIGDKSELSDQRRGLVVMIPRRLGIDGIHPQYHEAIKHIFQLKQSVGIIGGKPNSSYFFLGYQNDDQLIYLDPHVINPYVDLSDHYLDPQLISTDVCLFNINDIIIINILMWEIDVS